MSMYRWNRREIASDVLFSWVSSTCAIILFASLSTFLSLNRFPLDSTIIVPLTLSCLLLVGLEWARNHKIMRWAFDQRVRLKNRSDREKIGIVKLSSGLVISGDLFSISLDSDATGVAVGKKALSWAGVLPRTTSRSLVVVGIGGGGTNAVHQMIARKLKGVSFIEVNTEAQALQMSRAERTVLIGESVTRGIGAGGDPVIGEKAALESIAELRDAIPSADVVFVVAGMGGGTGTGAAPVVAQIAKETGALVIGVVTKPFSFEGTRRRLVSENGLLRLKGIVDKLIVIPNDGLLEIADSKISIQEAFRMADDAMLKTVQGLSEMIVAPGIVKPDYEYFKSIMRSGGAALMSVGHGHGENRTQEAAEAAIRSPLLEVGIERAKDLLVSVRGDEGLTIFEVEKATAAFEKALSKFDSSLLLGIVVDPSMRDEVQIMMIASGFPREVSSRITEIRSNDTFWEKIDLDLPTSHTFSTLYPEIFMWRKQGRSSKR